MSEAWKQDHDWAPKIDRKVRRWFRYLTAARLESSGSANDDRIDRSAIIAILEAQIADLIVWVPSASYGGKGYSAGQWQEREGPYWEAYVEAKRDVCRAYDAERLPTLGDWLRAEGAGTLLFKGAAGGTEQLPTDMYARTLEKAEKRRPAGDDAATI